MTSAVVGFSKAAGSPYLDVLHEPRRPLQQAHALLHGAVAQLPVQQLVRVQVVEGHLALRARGRVPVQRPLKDAVHCGRAHRSAEC